MGYLFILILFAGLFLAAGKRVPGKDCFFRGAAFLYDKLPFLRMRNDKLSGNLKKLYPQEKTEESRKHFEIERIRFFLLILFVGDLAALLLWISETPTDVLTDGAYIFRKKQGEGSKTALLTARGQGGEKVDVDLTVLACRYSDAELERLYEEMLPRLKEMALAGNESWDRVTQDLNLMDSIEGYPFLLQWESGNYAAVTGDGQVADWEDTFRWEEDSKLVSLYVTATYFDFEREVVFYARICPQQSDLSFEEQVRQSVRQAHEADPYEEKIILPGVIGEETVSWSERKLNRSRNLFWMGALAAVLVWIFKVRDLEQKVGEKNVQMEEEYASIVSKLTLYLGAGLNVKSAWQKIAEEGKENPVYEEMTFTCREMDGGIGETEAYERFGKRLRLQRYIRLSTLLVQNLQKGNAALLVQLRQEVALSQEDLAAAVRRKGEEISTKLLFPMILLLGMVMVWIMLPAFLSL